jgi:lysophospholipase L1-like esterase
MPCGRLKTLALAANHTTHLQMELEAPFYAIRIGVPNIHTGTIANVKVAVGPQTTAFAAGNSSNLNTSGGWINATFAGASSVTLPARVAAERPSWTWTDWIYCPSVARADGGARPLLVARVEIPTASAQASIPQNGMTNWADGVTNGGRMFRRSSQAVLGVTTTGDMTSATITNTDFVPLAVEYALANGVGRQFLIVGDSTVEGVGPGDLYGHAQRAVQDTSTPTAPAEYFNGALHGQTAAVYTEYLSDVIAMVAPDVLIFSPYSVNSFSTTISTGTMQQYRGVAGRALALAGQRDASVVLLTGIPCDAAFKAITGDSSRRALNTELLAISAPNVAVADIAALFGGAINGSDQQEIAAGLSDDNVHPNAAGYALLKTPIAAAIAALPV